MEIIIYINTLDFETEEWNDLAVNLSDPWFYSFEGFDFA